MTERTNEAWVDSLRAGGQAREIALAELRPILLDGLRRGLVETVYISGGEFAALADDFVQEALLRILDNLNSFEGRSKFTTWAYKIATRVALTELRRKRWQNRSLDELISGEAPLANAALLADHLPTPEKQTERTEILQRLNDIIHQELTDRQRQAILTVPIGGVPLAEAAERLGMNRNAFYKLLHDARLRIKRKLEEEGLTPDDILALFED